MYNPHGPPRRVSLGYILGFSDKPFKDPKPPSPPRPRRPNHLAELVASPGGIVEWTASDGRKGTLTGTGKPRLTAAALAKVPCNTGSAKAPTAAKDASKKAASTKHVNNLVESWDFGNSGFNEEKKRSTKSVSKKALSNKEDPWGVTLWDDRGSNKTSQKASRSVGKVSDSGVVADPWVLQVVATDMETKQDEKKGEKSEVKADEQKTSIVTNQAVAPDATTAVKDDLKKPDNSNAWTKEQDDKMLQMKTENGNTAWNTIAMDVGKPAKQCKERWKVIMPTDWKPNDAKKKSDKGDMGKKTEAKSHAQKGTNSVSGSKKSEDKKDSKDADGTWVGGFGDLPNESSDDKQDEEKKASDWNNWNHVSGATNTGWEAVNTGDANQVKDNTDSWGNVDGANDANDKNDGLAWEQTGGNAIAAPWETKSQHPKSNTGSGIQVFNTQEWSSAVKPASAPRSNKAPSEACTHRSNTSKSKPTSNSHAEIELEPDENFSANDLRLIARILQQDCSLVWNRISWRFRDKTGRTLHPDVFEKKITGTVEGKRNDS